MFKKNYKQLFVYKHMNINNLTFMLDTSYISGMLILTYRKSPSDSQYKSIKLNCPTNEMLDSMCTYIFWLMN